MSSDAALIEEIVGRVLRELGTMPAAPARAPASAPVREPGAGEPSLAASVVTRGLLEELPFSTRTIRVGPKAILTPSARDYIRQHGLTVLREAKILQQASRSRWQVLVSRSAPHVVGALDALRSAGVEFESHLSGAAPEVVGSATSALCRGESAGVVVLSDQPELVACLANRNENVRAAALFNTQTLDRLRGSFQPNLLAVDPLEKSLFELRQLLSAIFADGPTVARRT